MSRHYGATTGAIGICAPRAIMAYRHDEFSDRDVTAGGHLAGRDG
jgi:hypothetical protein